MLNVRITSKLSVCSIHLSYSLHLTSLFYVAPFNGFSLFLIYFTVANLAFLLANILVLQAPCLLLRLIILLDVLYL